jgi:hypothetical protein
MMADGEIVACSKAPPKLYKRNQIRYKVDPNPGNMVRFVCRTSR